ncbi:MAG: hypothetical protein JO026_02045, partial [Patescibacteria group bacterium]|nr:hypothetical protein [Patescibacteria group bacterium]
IKRKQDPTDKRAHKLVLSAASKKRVNDFKKKRIALALKLFKALTDEEFLEYVALQKKLLHSTK